MKRFFCLILAACGVILGGCVRDNSHGNSNRIVAASFYPVYIFTLNLLDGVEGVEVRCMAEQSVGCLHDYTLSAKDAKLLSDAEVLVINGAGMESFVEDAWKNNTDIVIIDSSEGIKTICEEEHHTEHKSDSHIGHNHSHEENSHIWLSVENAESQIENIKKGLIEKFPEYKGDIENNFQNYIERLAKLEKERELCASKLNSEKVISFHGAYGYIAQDVGLDILKTVESDEGAEPSGKVLAHLSDEIKENDVKALFIYPDYSGACAEILYNETGVKVYSLNPITSGEESPTAYEDIMSENYKIILKAVK